MSLCALLAGCDDTTVLAKAAVQYGVLKITEDHPEKAANILRISGEIRAIAGQDGFNTVDLLISTIKLKANFSKLSPADQMIAGILIDEIGVQLKKKVGAGPLTSEKLLKVAEVAGWVEDAAKLASIPPKA